MCSILIESAALRRSHDNVPASNLLHASQHGLRQHHHPWPAAVRFVIGRPMFVARKLTQIPYAYIDQPLLDSARDHTLGEEWIEHARKDRDEINPHRYPPANRRLFFF